MSLRSTIQSLPNLYKPIYSVEMMSTETILNVKTVYLWGLPEGVMFHAIDTNSAMAGMAAPHHMAEIINQGYDLIVDKRLDGESKPLTPEQRREYAEFLL